MSELIRQIKTKASLMSWRLLFKKPLFIIRFLLRLVQESMGREFLLKSVLFHTHYRCNLKCTHCYEKRFVKEEGTPLTLDEKKKSIKDALDLGALSFDFVSGESSLDENLDQLVKVCKPWKTYITLATNGYDFTLDKIVAMKRSGIDKFNISLDSWFEEEHDEIRGVKGAYGKVFETMELCRKAGMEFQLTVFVYKGSTKSEGFRKLVDYVDERGIRLAFKAAVPLGSWEGRDEMLIDDEDRETLYELNRRNPAMVRTCVPNEESRCPAVKSLIAITAYGDILPCNTLHISMGNIRNNSLASIVNKGKKTDFLNSGYCGCPPAENREFIEKYMSKTYSSVNYPVPVEEVTDEENKGDLTDGK